MRIIARQELLYSLVSVELRGGFAAGGGLIFNYVRRTPYYLRGKWFGQRFGEYGLAPLSGTKKNALQTGHLITAGITFGVGGKGDLRGGGLSSTFPMAGFAEMYKLLSFKNRAIGEFLGILSGAHRGTHFRNRIPGVLQFTASDDWKSSAILYGDRTFNLSATRYFTSEPVELTSLSSVLEVITGELGATTDEMNSISSTLRGLERTFEQHFGNPFKIV